MQVYHYRPDTKEYVGNSKLPRLPAHSTSVQPPQATINQVAVFDEAKQNWSLQADHRGLVYAKADGSELNWQEIGDLPDKYTSTAPPKNYDPATHSFDENTNRWIEIHLNEQDIFSQRQQNLRGRLLDFLNNPVSDIDNPILTCLLLNSAAASSLPLSVSKQEAASTEAISTVEKAKAKEQTLMAGLLARYKKVSELISQVNSARSNSELDLLEAKVKAL